jgi:hypothetical protein
VTPVQTQPDPQIAQVQPDLSPVLTQPDPQIAQVQQDVLSTQTQPTQSQVSSPGVIQVGRGPGPGTTSQSNPTQQDYLAAFDSFILINPGLVQNVQMIYSGSVNALNCEIIKTSDPHIQAKCSCDGYGKCFASIVGQVNPIGGLGSVSFLVGDGKIKSNIANIYIFGPATSQNPQTGFIIK